MCDCYKESGRTKVLSELFVTEEKSRTFEPGGEESHRRCQRFLTQNQRMPRRFSALTLFYQVVFNIFNKSIFIISDKMH
jgi:hypothetical protein